MEVKQSVDVACGSFQNRIFVCLHVEWWVRVGTGKPTDITESLYVNSSHRNSGDVCNVFWKKICGVSLDLPEMSWYEAQNPVCGFPQSNSRIKSISVSWELPTARLYCCLLLVNCLSFAAKGGVAEVTAWYKPFDPRLRATSLLSTGDRTCKLRLLSPYLSSRHAPKT